MATGQGSLQHDSNMVDALIICDNRDYDVLIENKCLQNAIEKENLNVCYAFDGKDPNMSMLGRIDAMVGKSTCIVLYISGKFCENEYMKYLTEPLSKPGLSEKLIIISTFPCEKVKSDFIWLATCTIISQVSHGWESKLIKEIQSEVLCYPSFCKPLLPQRVLNSMCKLGHSLSRLKRDKLGVILQKGKQVLEIDFDAFANHKEEHCKLDVDRVCTECTMLCSIDTSISIIVDETEGTHFRNILENSHLLAWLSFFVFDVKGVINMETDWILGCLVQGKPLNDKQLLKKLYWTISDFLVENTNGDDERRLESFHENWSPENILDITKLVDAGFFFSHHLAQTQCFHCGVNITLWNKGDDACLKHAAIRP